MHWHFRLVSSPNKAYLVVLTMYLACSYSSFWLISSTFVEQRSVIQRFCENQYLNNVEMRVSAPVEGKAAAQLPACADQRRGWPAYRDRPFGRKHLQYRLPLSQGGDREHGKKLIILWWKGNEVLLKAVRGMQHTNLYVATFQNLLCSKPNLFKLISSLFGSLMHENQRYDAPELNIY